MKKGSARLPSKKRKKLNAIGKLRRLSKVIKKKTPKISSQAQRDAIAEEVATFLKAGNEISHVPSGVSGLDPMGRGKPTTHGQHKK